MGHSNKSEELALLLAHRLLTSLADPKLAVASETVRNQARAILKHYPPPIKINLLYNTIEEGKQNGLPE